MWGLDVILRNYRRGHLCAGPRSAQHAAAAAGTHAGTAGHTSGADTGHRCSRSLPRSSVLCVVELTWCLRKPKPNLFHALMNNRLHAYALLVVATKPHNKARR